VTARVARARAIAAPGILILGGLLLVLGVVAGYLNRTVLDADAFADRADTVRRDPAVSRELGEALTDAYLQRTPDAVALRPLLDTVGATIATVGTGSGVDGASVGACVTAGVGVSTGRLLATITRRGSLSV